MSEQVAVRLTVYSDVLCPWCYNGAVRLARIKEEFGDIVEIQWKCFLLRPYPEPKSFEKFRRYTQTWMRPAEQPDAGEFRVWSTDAPPPSHSVPPNVAVKAAARQRGFERYHLPLMRAYFYENRDVTDPDTIVAVAEECGLDIDRFLVDLKDESVGREVVADHQEAIERGVTGVPAVVVDDTFPIPGAQDVAFYRHLVHKRLSAREEETCKT